jgi:hypothetical protein
MNTSWKSTFVGVLLAHCHSVLATLASACELLVPNSANVPSITARHAKIAPFNTRLELRI